MPIPSSMSDLSLTAANNSPQGTDPIGNTLDDYLRSIQAILRSTNALSPASIASASTTDIGSAAAESVEITGTTTITSFGTAPAGIRRELRFTGSLTITHSSSIQLPGATNWQTAPGDVLTFRSLGSGQWIMTGHQSLDAARLTGTLSDARLSSNIARLNASQTITGAWTFQNAPDFNSGGAAIRLKPGAIDNVVMEFYARSAQPNVRSGWIGYDSPGSNDLHVRNEISGGSIHITATNGSIALNGTSVTVSGELTASGWMNVGTGFGLRHAAGGRVFTDGTHWHVRSVTPSEAALTLQDVNGINRCALYEDSGSFGLIDSTGNWTLRLSSGHKIVGNNGEFTYATFYIQGARNGHTGIILQDGIHSPTFTTDGNLIGIFCQTGPRDWLFYDTGSDFRIRHKLVDMAGQAYLKSNFSSANVTISTSGPSGGNDGDIWLQVV